MHLTGDLVRVKRMCMAAAPAFPTLLDFICSMVELTSTSMSPQSNVSIEPSPIEVDGDRFSPFTSGNPLGMERRLSL